MENETKRKVLFGEKCSLEIANSNVMLCIIQKANNVWPSQH